MISNPIRKKLIKDGTINDSGMVKCDHCDKKYKEDDIYAVIEIFYAKQLWKYDFKPDGDITIKPLVKPWGYLGGIPIINSIVLYINNKFFKKTIYFCVCDYCKDEVMKIDEKWV